MIASIARQASYRAAASGAPSLACARVGAARSTMAQLARMSDDELRDIGLVRQDVVDVGALRRDADRSASAGGAPPRGEQRSRPDRQDRPSPSGGKTVYEGRRRSSSPARRSPMTAHPAAPGIHVHAKPGARQAEISQQGRAGLPCGLAPALRRPPARAPGAAHGAAEAVRRRAASAFPDRDEAGARRRLEGRADPGRPARPPGRDHRPGRPQDDHQRAELGRQGVHGRLRGRLLAHVRQHDRGPGQSEGSLGRRDRLHRSGHRQGLRAREQARRR